MTTTPADEMRAAAARLRALATAASTDTDGTPTTTWSTKLRRPDNPDGNSLLYGDHHTRDDGRRIAWPPLLHGGSQQRPVSMHTQHADYIAMMDPTLGHAVAVWLEAEAAAPVTAEHSDQCVDPQCTTLAALAVARQVLGTTTPLAGKAQRPGGRTDEIPLGHSTPSHRVLGWCSHCPGRSLAEELAAWQVDALDRTTAPDGDEQDAEMERLRTEIDRMRHELEVMYGRAFDSPPAPADRAAILREAADTVDATDLPDDYVDLFDNGARWATTQVRRLADEAQPTDGTKRPEDAARRFARRLHAVEQLCSGRPGYHTVTVKTLLTAMGDANDEAQQPTPRRRCAHTDVLYGQCVRYLDDHDGDCIHEQQPAPAATEDTTR
jgi:hypothetical protein